MMVTGKGMATEGRPVASDGTEQVSLKNMIHLQVQRKGSEVGPLLRNFWRSGTALGH